MWNLGLLGAAGATVEASGAFDLLATEILASSTPSVTFSGLSAYAANYKHLQIRATMRSTRADTDSYIYIRFNGDAAAGNYEQHHLSGNGSTVAAERYGTARPYGIVDLNGTPGSSAPANSFGAWILDIFDPFETTKNTTTRVLSGQSASYKRVGLESGIWLNTASVTSISLADIFGQLASGCRISLYGLKAA